MGDEHFDKLQEEILRAGFSRHVDVEEPPVSTINLVLNWDVELERLTRSTR